MRPTKKDYYLGIAEAVSKRSTCLRAHAGTVIVKDDVIIGTGYNGSARNEINCCDIGICKRQQENANPGERYDLCPAIHSEVNAILNSQTSCKDAILYLYFERLDGRKSKHGGPCISCGRVIKNAMITEVITEEIT